MNYAYYWGLLSAGTQPGMSPFWRAATIRQFGGEAGASGAASPSEATSLDAGTALGLKFFHDVRQDKLLPGLPGEVFKRIGPGYPETQFQPGR
jgi:hypothetical protein